MPSIVLSFSEEEKFEISFSLRMFEDELCIDGYVDDEAFRFYNDNRFFQVPLVIGSLKAGNQQYLYSREVDKLFFVVYKYHKSTFVKKWMIAYREMIDEKLSGVLIEEKITILSELLEQKEAMVINDQHIDQEAKNAWYKHFAEDDKTVFALKYNFFKNRKIAVTHKIDLKDVSACFPLSESSAEKIFNDVLVVEQMKLLQESEKTLKDVQQNAGGNHEKFLTSYSQIAILYLVEVKQLSGVPECKEAIRIYNNNKLQQPEKLRERYSELSDGVAKVGTHSNTINTRLTDLWAILPFVSKDKRAQVLQFISEVEEKKEKLKK